MSEEILTQPHEGICFACGTGTRYLCPQCNKFFCAEHSAIFNKRLCLHCGPCTMQIEKTEGLTGSNGEQHHGRKFKLIGEGWPNELEKIKDLSDTELDDKIFYYQNLLKEVVRSRDTLIITVGALENESIGRKAKKIRTSGQLTKGLSFTPSTDRVTRKDTSDPQQKAVAKLAKTMGLSLEQAEKVYKKLKAIG